MNINVVRRYRCDWSLGVLITFTLYIINSCFTRTYWIQSVLRYRYR